MKVVDVAAGLIIKESKVLVARRKAGLHMAGFWEFPGGKIEANETPEQCLIRELKEELGIEVKIGPFIGQNTHHYSDKTVRLMAFQVEHVSGEFELTEHDELKWLNYAELGSVNWAPADIPLLDHFKTHLNLHDFYQQNAEQYALETLNMDVSGLYKPFTDALKPHAHILDLGCGAGRDSLYFKRQGFQVTALDGSAELAAIAQVTIDQAVLVGLFQDIDFNQEFDAVWACASLLHCPANQLPDVLKRVALALKEDGIFYASFKWGNGETFDSKGRLFNNLTINSLTMLLNHINDLQIIECWQETKPLRDGHQQWVNLLARKRAKLR